MYGNGHRYGIPQPFYIRLWTKIKRLVVSLH